MVPKIRTFSMRLSLTETVYMLLHDSKDLKDFSFDSTLFAPNIDTFKFFLKFGLLFLVTYYLLPYEFCQQNMSLVLKQKCLLFSDGIIIR